MKKIIAAFLLISQIVFGQFSTIKTQAENVLITDILQTDATHSQYSTLQDFINIICSGGKISGGNIFPSDSGRIHVSSAEVMLKTTESKTGVTAFVKIDSVSNLSLVDSSTNYIIGYYNNGNPIVYATTDPTPIFGLTTVFLNAVHRQGNELRIISTVDNAFPSFFARLVLKEVEKNVAKGFGFAERISGAEVDSTNGRYIKINSGIFYAGYDRFTNNSFNSFTTVSDTFNVIYRNGSGGFIKLTGRKQINNTQFDNGTGILQSLQVNRFSNRWLYLSFDGKEIDVVFGRNEYVLLNDALNSSPPLANTLPNYISTFSTPLAQIVAQQGSDILTIKLLQ